MGLLSKSALIVRVCIIKTKKDTSEYKRCSAPLYLIKIVHELDDFYNFDLLEKSLIGTSFIKFN